MTKLRVLVLASASMLATAEICHLYSRTIESPCFKVVYDGDEYQIREYASRQAEFWTNAHIAVDSFAAAQNSGFYVNFDYIEGANDRKETIPMTAPVIFRKNETRGWQVGFFTPSKYQRFEDVPEPTDALTFLRLWYMVEQDDSVSIVQFPRKVRYAVRMFSGFAGASDYASQSEELRKRLLKDDVALVPIGEWSEVWAGYDSPFVYVNRHNEVWIQVPSV